jgi:hypothetical protein
MKATDGGAAPESVPGDGAAPSPSPEAPPVKAERLERAVYDEVASIRGRVDELERRASPIPDPLEDPEPAAPAPAPAAPPKTERSFSDYLEDLLP